MNGQHIETTYEEAAAELMLANVTRTQAGNYSCQGLNGASRASEISPAKELLVQCKQRIYFIFLLSAFILIIIIIIIITLIGLKGRIRGESVTRIKPFTGHYYGLEEED